MSEKEFVKGMNVNRRENAPAFVIANIGIKVDDFILWLRSKQAGEWVNIDIKLSQKGSYYAELNTYNQSKGVEKKEPKTLINSSGSIQYPAEDIYPDKIPF